MTTTNRTPQQQHYDRIVDRCNDAIILLQRVLAVYCAGSEVDKELPGDVAKFLEGSK